jgi:hypothetical protein
VTGAPLSRILGYEKPLVCLVRFSDKFGAVNGIPREAPHVFYQVVVDPEARSKSGAFIQFGSMGDQIAGWKPVESIEVHEILGECTDRAKGTMRDFTEPSNVETMHTANMADAEFHEKGSRAA